MVKKWAMTWNVVEVRDTADQYAYAEWSWLLRGLIYVLHFGTLCPLAVAGVILTWRERRRLWLLYVLLIGYAANVALSFVFARLRMPLVPMLVLFAAAGIAQAAALIANRGYRKLAMTGIVALAAFVFVTWPLLPRDEGRATIYFNVANALVSQGRAAEAIQLFETVLKLRPESAPVHSTYGTTLARLGRLEEALSQNRDSSTRQPRNTPKQSGLIPALPKPTVIGGLFASARNGMTWLPRITKLRCASILHLRQPISAWESYFSGRVTTMMRLGAFLRQSDRCRPGQRRTPI